MVRPIRARLERAESKRHSFPHRFAVRRT